MKLILRYSIILFVIISFSYAKMSIIGGFSAPIYVNHYNPNELNDIIKNDKIKSILITYPDQQANLANKITKYIKMNNSKINVKLDKLNLIDTDTVKYRHDVVTITLFFK